jgi:ParB-like chromosome segregation protein Spo0J
VINEIRLALREHSPLKREPVDCVLWVRAEQLHANDYNPNSVAPLWPTRTGGTRPAAT